MASEQQPKQPGLMDKAKNLVGAGGEQEPKQPKQPGLMDKTKNLVGAGGEQEPKQPKQGLMDKAKNFVAEKVAHVPKPEASLDGVSFKSMSRDSITLHSNINVNNPYDYRLPICDVTYKLKCAGRVVASGTLPDPGWIAANGDTKLEIPAKVPYDFLVSIVRDVGSDWDVDYTLEVGLTIDLPVVGNLTIPLSTSGELKLPTLKDMF